MKDKDPVNYDLAVLVNSCDQGYGIFMMDDISVFFFEKWLSSLFNLPNGEFTKTHFLVVLDTLFKMMENGLYSVDKLRLILLHLSSIRPLETSEDAENDP